MQLEFLAHFPTSFSTNQRRSCLDKLGHNTWLVVYQILEMSMYSVRQLLRMADSNRLVCLYSKNLYLAV